MKGRILQILLADDHPLIRAGMRELLGKHFNAEFTEAASAQETLGVGTGRCWDLILLDISMPGRSGLDILADLKKCCPKAPILIVSAQDEEQFATHALRAGAAGYISKTSSPAELIKGAERLLAGGRYVSERFAESLALALQRGTPPRPLDVLSARELEVLQMIVAGKSGKQIAGDLSISFKTVSTYRTRLMDKLNVHSNAELSLYAAREGLI